MTAQCCRQGSSLALACTAGFLPGACTQRWRPGTPQLQGGRAVEVQAMLKFMALHPGPHPEPSSKPTRLETKGAVWAPPGFLAASCGWGGGLGGEPVRSWGLADCRGVICEVLSCQAAGRRGGGGGNDSEAASGDFRRVRAGREEEEEGAPGRTRCSAPASSLQPRRFGDVRPGGGREGEKEGRREARRGGRSPSPLFPAAAGVRAALAR